MKTILKHRVPLLLSLTLLLMAFGIKCINAQQYPPADPGIEFVLVTFDQTPSSVTVEKTPLRYSKDFALSFHTDDGIEDVYTLGFRFFTGINGNGTNYPGLFYTDGCGNDISFKISSALFSYSGFNNEDMHQPGNFYGTVTWPQLAEMYLNNCGIYNHGFTSDAYTDPAYMSYSIRRNQSFIRRRLLNTTPGGVQTRVFVNPNGVTNYTPAAFNEGYSYAFRMGSNAVIPNNGIDVNTFNNWDQNLELNRAIAENENVTATADFLANNSINGANYWKSLFTHSIVTDYPQSQFIGDFNYIANTYGKNGQDNIWMATEEEILNYLLIHQNTTVNYGLAGNSLLILFEGSIPSDLRFYALSLMIEATGANITGIQINGGTNNTFNGIGQSSALVNLEWDGRYIPDMAELADYHVTIAEGSQGEYDCLVAMDYVFMVPAGDAQDELRERLCAIEGIPYDDGFCITCEVDLGPDQEICQGDCVQLFVPFEEGTEYLWSDGSTSNNILVCPMEDTSYWVQITTAEDCVASDTITIFVLESPLFDFGEDLELCTGTLVSLEGPIDPDYTYEWFVNGEFNGNTTELFAFEVEETVTIGLEVTSPNGCLAFDEIIIIALPLPEVELGEDFEWCEGQMLTIEGPEGDGFGYAWFINGELSDTTSFQLTFVLGESSEIVLEVTTAEGCSASDTLFVTAIDAPLFDLGDDMQVCNGETVLLQAPYNVDYIYEWFLNGQPIANNTHTYQLVVADTMQVVLIITDPGGCPANDTINIFGLEQPLITVTPQTADLCLGQTIDLGLSTMNATGFFWWDGSTQQNRPFTPTDLGMHYLWAEAVNGLGCTNRDTAFVNVVATPDVALSNLSGSNQVCIGEEVTIVAIQQNQVSFQYIIWNDGETLPAASNLSKSFVITESRWIKAIVISANGCTDSDSLYITAVEPPNITVTPSMESCAGEPVLLEASGGVNCIWYEGTTIIGQEFDITVSPMTTTTYTAIVTGPSPAFCTASADVTITVLPAPEVTIEASDTLVCPGAQVLLTASGALTYEWAHGHEGAEALVKPTETTTYTVFGTNDIGCTGVSSIVIETKAVEEVNFTGLLPVYCLNDAPANLFGFPAGGTFSGNGIVGSQFRPIVAGDGVHMITYSLINFEGCLSADSMKVTVFGGITAINLGSDTLICPFDFLTLDAGPGFTDYYWSTGDTSRFISISGTDYMPGTTRTISVVGVLSGCTASGSVKVTIRDDCFVDIEEVAAAPTFRIIPNPNRGDFLLQHPYTPDDLHIEVYNSFGMLVYTGMFNDCQSSHSPCRIQLPDFPAGVYLVAVRTGNSRAVQRMVIQ